MNQKYQYVNWHEILCLAVKQTGKCALYISGNFAEISTEQEKAMEKYFASLGLNEIERANIYSAFVHNDVIFFDNADDMNALYKLFEDKVYASVFYACTFDAQGKPITENT